MENYIMLNGKRIDLTAEQIETLVGKKEKDPFERVEGETYFYIDCDGEVISDEERGMCTDKLLYAAGNYCTDKELMEQRALHETLGRLLWRYSMQHGGRDTNSFGAGARFGLVKIGEEIEWTVIPFATPLGTAWFCSQTAATNAIEEIVKPFMEKHPEFRW